MILEIGEIIQWSANCYLQHKKNSTVPQWNNFYSLELVKVEEGGDCIDRVATGYSAPMITNPAIGLVVTTQDLLNTVHGSSTM
jgi:hypothetical protein